MNPDAARAIKYDCQQFTSRFYWHLDNREHEELSRLFADDGLWLRQGKKLCGPAAVLDELSRRSATMVTRHVIANQIIDVIDEHHLRSQCYITLYYSDTGSAPAQPVRFTGPTCLFTYHDELRCNGDEWRICRKWSTMDFSSL